MAKKRRSVIKIVIVIAVIVIIALIAGTVLYFMGQAGMDVPLFNTTKVSRFEQFLLENNYQAAYTIYSQTTEKTAEDRAVQAHLETYFALCFSEEYDSTVTWQKYKGLEIFRPLIEDKVTQKLNETVQRYYSGEFSLGDVKVYLSRIGKFSFSKETLTLCVEEAEKKTVSDTAYSKAMEYYSNGQYPEAVTEFKKVSSMDQLRYAYAVEGIQRCKQEYGTQQIALAENMVSVYNIEGAQSVLEELIQLFEDYPEAEEMLEGINDNRESD